MHVRRLPCSFVHFLDGPLAGERVHATYGLTVVLPVHHGYGVSHTVVYRYVTCYPHAIVNYMQLLHPLPACCAAEQRAESPLRQNC